MALGLERRGHPGGLTFPRRGSPQRRVVVHRLVSDIRDVLSKERLLMVW
jgi:hypothetical protein